MSTCKLNLDDLNKCFTPALHFALTGNGIKLILRQISQDSLIRQSLDCLLIQFLLGLLKSRANITGNPATTIAQIVSALKTMAQNLNYGDQVVHILNSDPVWAEFKDQNHDLFIMDTHKRGMITGGEFPSHRSSATVTSIIFRYPNNYLSQSGPSNSVAGYLTQAPNKKTEVVMTPPPVDRDDFTGYPKEE